MPTRYLGQRLLIVFVCALVACVLWGTRPPAVDAATLTVTKVADTNDGTCNADCSLREAINAASSGDTVSVPAGTYTLGIAGAGEDAGATGDLDVFVDLTIDGAGSGSTVIDGNELDRVLDAPLSDLTLDGLTVRDGNTTGNGGGIQAEGLTLTDVVVTSNNGNQGGGIVAADLTMTNSHVDANTSLDQGGGIWMCCTNAEFTITGSTVDDNTGGDQGGGIFHCCGAFAFTLTDSNVSGNSAQDQGGGIFFCCGDETLASTIVVDGSEVSGNSSTDQGGGIFVCCENGPAVDIEITASQINNNTAAQEGGGLYDCCNGGTTTVSDSTISGNSAGDDGGGIYSDADVFVLTNSIVSGNSVTGTEESGGGLALDGLEAVILYSQITGNDAGSDGEGGGVYNDADELVIGNSTISGNSATLGGGIYNDSIAVFLINVTIVNNTAEDTGGGFFNGGDQVSVLNSIIADGVPNACADDESPLISDGHNINDDESCGFSEVGDLLADPQLGPLADNGGDTLTHLPLVGSPAIDAGDDEFCPPDDQRFVDRPQGDGCDIGAVEGFGEGEPDPTPTPTRTATPTRTPSTEEPESGLGAPDFEATETPVPAESPLPTQQPSQPDATSPAGNVSAGGTAPVTAPDAGDGPAGRRSPLDALLLLCAAAAVLVSGAGIVIGKRGR